MFGADRFIDAAAHVCREAQRLGIHNCAVLLHRCDGPPVLAVDNAPDISDEQRLEFGVGERAWKQNALYVELSRKVGVTPVGAEMLRVFIEQGYAGRTIYPLAVPLIGPAGWFATIVFSAAAPVTVELERELVMLAMQLSAWCVERGIGRVHRSAEGTLSARRFRTAQLAAEGKTNAEIADQLGISINTVKAQLKRVFAQLGVENRTELAREVRRLAPLTEVGEGITRMGDVTVTRARG